MKKYLCTCIILLTCHLSFGQNIKFDYDLAGNRIKRYSSTAIDLTIGITRPYVSNYTLNQEREGILRIYNLTAFPTTGPVIAYLELGSAFELRSNPTAVTSSGFATTNSEWNLTDYNGTIEFISKTGTVILANSFVNLAFKVKAVGTVSSSGILTATLINQTGSTVPEQGDTNDNNNVSVKVYSIIP